MIQSITEVLAQRGPLTGAELLEAGSFTDVLELWRACHAPDLRRHRTGRRYMRLDSAVDGYARLSPSIRREFLTYTLIALAGQTERLQARTTELEKSTADISRDKLRLARESLCMALATLPDEALILKHVTFMIAGDITYQMAHRVPRPERSSGQMVRGSDLDIIAVTSDTLPQAVSEQLDEAIYRQKHYLLTHPDLQEEIDYILKPLSRVGEQLTFQTFEHMVACKILCECELLYGSPFLFDTVMKQVEESGVRDKLDAMQKAAEAFRTDAEKTLLNPLTPNPDGYLHLFYTREESDEIY